LFVILFALTKNQLSTASGFTAAFQVVAGVLPGPVATALGWLVALCIVIALALQWGHLGHRRRPHLRHCCA